MRAVIPAAGLGTRLLPATKEQPKEMLPLFSSSGKEILLKPLLQLIFERLFDADVIDFCLIIGRGKRAIEDHFTPDYGYMKSKRNKEKTIYTELERFYKRLRRARIIWVNQPEAKGFGDAVMKASVMTGEDSVIVHAGDTYLASQERYLDSLSKAFIDHRCDGVFLVEWMGDPSSKGVVDAEQLGSRLYKVTGIVEKPEKPPSHLAVVPIYIFKPRIFHALKRVKPGVDGEVQLTDAIQILIEDDAKIYAVGLKPGEAVLDIGNPHTYWRSLSKSWELAQNQAAQNQT